MRSANRLPDLLMLNDELVALDLMTLLKKVNPIP